MRAVDGILEDSGTMEWIVEYVKWSVNEFEILPLKVGDNRAYCEYLRCICGYAYKIHLFYSLRMF